MTQGPMAEPTAESVEHVLREELSRSDMMIASAPSILQHLLVNDDNALFSEEMIARVRGMLLNVAEQLLLAEATVAQVRDQSAYIAGQQEAIVQAFFEEAAFLSHVHALALEAKMAERLRARGGIESVLPPLVQELAASAEGAMAGLAMSALAAQARFLQYHRRMELPLTELPGDLFHRALLILVDHRGGGVADAAANQLRGHYQEATSRLGILAQLVMGMSQDAPRALAIENAGVSIFATALAMASGQTRDIAVFSFADRQFARFALALRAAGLKPQAVEEQFLLIHPEIALPPGFDMLRTDRAAALLAYSSPESAF